MDQQTYWDRAASEKEFTTPFQMEVFKIHVPETSFILDVGCGYGRTMNELYHEGFKNISGIDFSQKMIERGLGLYPYLDLKKSSSVFSFDDNTFDAVLLVAVLTCIAENKRQKFLMGEIQRVLKPHGILYINDFLINNDQRNVDRYEKFEKVYGTYGVFELDEGALLRHHTEDHLFELTTNFQTLEFETLKYITMNKHESRGFYYLGELKDKKI